MKIFQSRLATSRVLLNYCGIVYETKKESEVDETYISGVGNYDCADQDIDNLIQTSTPAINFCVSDFLIEVNEVLSELVVVAEANGFLSVNLSSHIIGMHRLL